MIIDPRTYYWLVGDDERVYSGATNTYVPATDQTYVGWLSTGVIPPSIDSEASLWQALATMTPTPMPDWMFVDGEFVQPGVGMYTDGQLKAYAAMKRWQRETSGIMFGPIQIATDDRSKLMITGARVSAAADPNFKTSWLSADGSVHVVTAQMIIAISQEVSDHVSGCFDIFATVASKIGTDITTLSQIDNAFA